MCYRGVRRGDKGCVMGVVERRGVDRECLVSIASFHFFFSSVIFSSPVLGGNVIKGTSILSIEGGSSRGAIGGMGGPWECG